MNRTKKSITLIISSILLVSLAGCGRSETGNKDSDSALKAFNAIVKEYPKNKGFHSALQHWGFKLPTGDKFEWTKDTSANKVDFAMVIAADPLIKAGLDVTKLDANKWVYKPAALEEGVNQPNRLIKPYNASDKKQMSNGSEDALRRILKQDPMLIKYNKEEKHFMLMLGDGSQVHWAETLGKTTEDMEFVLNPEPLIKAGLDVNKLEGSGWKLEKAGKDDMGAFNVVLVKGYKLK